MLLKWGTGSGERKSAVADPGEGPGGPGYPPLFLDQTDARRAEKNFSLFSYQTRGTLA